VKVNFQILLLLLRARVFIMSMLLISVSLSGQRINILQDLKMFLAWKKIHS